MADWKDKLYEFISGYLLREGTMDNFPCLLLLQCSTEWALPMPMYSMNLRQQRNENTIIIPLEMQEDLDRIITEAGI